MTTPALATLTNRQVRLAARPAGLPKPSDWQHTSAPVMTPSGGGIVLKTLLRWV